MSRALYSPLAVFETAAMSAGVGAPAARSTARVRLVPALLRGLLWVLLGGWIGSWLLFALVVAPTAFRVLSSPGAAGALVGPVLDALHLYGAAAGLALAALAAALGRGALRIALPLGMAVACLISQFGVSAELAEMRNLAFAPEGSEQVASRFNQLHQLSMGMYSVVLCAALLLAGLHAISDATSEK
jgi:hypothetical protein